MDHVGVEIFYSQLYSSKLFGKELADGKGFRICVRRCARCSPRVRFPAPAHRRFCNALKITIVAGNFDDATLRTKMTFVNHLRCDVGGVPQHRIRERREVEVFAKKFFR